jgi:L-fucose isomerase-like protein
LRNPKALIIPFRFREGYPDDLVDRHIALAVKIVKELKIDFDLAVNVINNNDAEKVLHDHNPNNYDFVILLIPTWIEPVLVLHVAKSYAHTPMIVWGFGTFTNSGERVFLGSMAGSGVTKGTLKEMGIQHEYLYMNPEDERTVSNLRTKLKQFANVARAIALLDRSRIISVGYLFGGMSVGDIDITRMRSRFGPELIEIDTYTLIQRMDAMKDNDDDLIKNRKLIEQNLKVSIGEKVIRIAKMYTVLHQFVLENQAQALTVKCNFELSQQYGLTACVPLSVLGNEIIAGCEADIPLLLTQMVLHYLSAGEVTTYADIHEISTDRILVAACGYAPSGLCIGGKIICDMPSPSPKGLGATFKDYITNKNYLKSGHVTLARVLKQPDCGFAIHFTSGAALGDIGRVSELDTPQYPFTEIQLQGNPDQFAQNMGSHHYAIIYSELSQELEMFCKYKDIRVIRD